MDKFYILDENNGTLVEYNRSVLVPVGTLDLAADMALGLCPYAKPSPSPSSSSGSLSTVAIVLPVVLGSILLILILAIITVLLYLKFYVKRRRYFDGNKNSAEDFRKDVEMDSAPNYTYREVDWGDLKLGKLLGRGAFGQVYKGQYR